MRPSDKKQQEAIADAQGLRDAGATLEMILLFLRDRSFDKIASIKAIRHLYWKSLDEAKRIIDHSEAWSDRFRNDMEFREMAWKALREVAASQDPLLPKIIIEGNPEMEQ